jgi:hypothetical protein
MIDTREKLQLLWIFLFLNFIFCDVFTLFHAPTLNQLLTGTVDGMAMSEPFLLAFAVLMEMGIVMVLVSRLAGHSFVRWANIIVGTLLIAVQGMTVFKPGLTLHYGFFSAIEIGALAWVVITALTWRQTEPSHSRHTIRKAPVVAAGADPSEVERS